MPTPITTATQPGRTWYRLSIHVTSEAMEALEILAKRFAQTEGTKVSLSETLRRAVIYAERATRTNEENLR